MADQTRLLPCNIDVERDVLGAILLHPPALFQAQEILTAEDFYLDSHRAIFRHLGEMQRAEIPINTLTLKNSLQKAQELEKCGGAVYIVTLTDGVPAALATAHYAGLIRDASIRRRVIQIASETMTKAYLDELKTSEIIETLQLNLLELTKNKESKWTPISELVKQAESEIERIVTEKRSLTGLDTGFKSLNSATRGFRPGELIILAGRPGHGKSSFASNIVDNMILRHGYSVGVFSLEMSGQELATRSILSESEIDSYEIHRIDRVGLGKEVWEKLHDACGSLHGRSLWIDDSGGLTITGLRSRAQRLKLEHDIDFLVIDYLQLMSGTGSRREQNREREISEISRGLKSLAKDLHIPILALSQLNRAIEHTERKPQLSDLRESGSLEQDSDVVLFIWREELRSDKDEHKGMAELIIGKQRAGRSGFTINLEFHGRFTKFKE